MFYLNLMTKKIGSTEIKDEKDYLTQTVKENDIISVILDNGELHFGLNNNGLGHAFTHEELKNPNNHFFVYLHS